MKQFESVCAILNVTCMSEEYWESLTRIRPGTAEKLGKVLGYLLGNLQLYLREQVFSMKLFDKCMKIHSLLQMKETKHDLLKTAVGPKNAQNFVRNFTYLCYSKERYSIPSIKEFKPEEAE